MKAKLAGVFLGIVFVCLGSMSVLANGPGEIRGQVFGEGLNASLPMAHVWVEYNGEKIVRFTDMDGRFTIKPLEPGVYNLTVTYTGMDTLLIQDIQVNPNKITFLKNIVVPVHTLGDYEVVFHRNLINPEDPSAMTLRSAQIEKNPLLRDPAALLESIGSEITRDPSGGLHFRGSRSGDEIYFIDGVKSRDGNFGIPGSSIGSLTVYTGGVPAKYGDVTGGVIIVETKSYSQLYNEWKQRSN